MEIIMKVKCSPSPGADSSSHSTLKIVDHHHQLQQHTFTNVDYKTSPPPNNVLPARTYSHNTHHTGNKYPINSVNTSCSDCSLGYCCNISTCCITTPSPNYSQTPPSTSVAPPFPHSEAYMNNSPSHTVDEPEFVSIDDEKVKQYLIRLGQQQLQNQQPVKQFPTQKEPKITRVVSTPTTSSENTAKSVVYEIIELDDEDEREKLKQIKQQAERSLANKKYPSNLTINFANRQTKSLDISLIPKNPENATLKSIQKMPSHNQQKSLRESNKNPSSHKIIAEIDLVESDEDDEYMNDDCDDDEDDDDTLPLAAVSCELKCDDEDVEEICKTSSSNYSTNPSYNIKYTGQRQPTTIKYSKPLVDDVVICGSYENKSSDDMMVRWEDYEGHRERVFFECFLCGKKVQSSYNLRRHMMIHTGERPFGCDLCDRRFREFSDMKKHRRRHCHEPKYLCMICNERPPLDNDPTRCINCCTQSKNAIIVASMNRATDADTSSDKNSPTKATNVAAITQPSPSSQQQTLPTISSVRSYNIAVIRTKSPPAFTSTSAANGSSTSSSSNNVDTKSPEKTQSLLENIPAVHRPGYNELGMITRKEFPCPLCNRAFGTRHNLKRHYMIHTGEKPFSCTKCRKPFREYSTLKKHMVTHMRERYYKCMHCPVKFLDFLKYTKHKQCHGSDSDSEEKPMAIYAKYNSMQSDGYMDSNDEDSGGEDWLECYECGQRFNEIDAYNDHVKEHDTTNQLFQCYICKQQMKSRAVLDQHIKQQHKLDMTDSMDEDNDDKEDATTA